MRNLYRAGAWWRISTVEPRPRQKRTYSIWAHGGISRTRDREHGIAGGELISSTGHAGSLGFQTTSLAVGVGVAANWESSIRCPSTAPVAVATKTLYLHLLVAQVPLYRFVTRIQETRGEILELKSVRRPAAASHFQRSGVFSITSAPAASDHRRPDVMSPADVPGEFGFVVSRPRSRVRLLLESSTRRS